MASPAVASVAPLLVKDVPRILPVNMSSMEQGWLLYRCTLPMLTDAHGSSRCSPRLTPSARSQR